MSNERKAGAWLTWPNRAGGNGVRRAPRLRRPGVMARVGLAVAALLATGLAEHEPGGHARRDAPEPPPVGC